MKIYLEVLHVIEKGLFVETEFREVFKDNHIIPTSGSVIKRCQMATFSCPFDEIYKCRGKYRPE